ANAAEMIDELEQRLAPLELTLALQYLYGLFSMHTPEEAPPGRWPTMHADLTAARQWITLIAVGEMTHLRWANQLLWGLDQAGLYPKGRHYTPVLTPLKGPLKLGGIELATLPVLDLATLDAYIRIERPEGQLANAYGRCVATLKLEAYPRDLYELAVRIDTDGDQHYERFRAVRQSFEAYAGAPGRLPVLREMRVGTADETRAALAATSEMTAALREAYAAEARREFEPAQAAITLARAAMDRLRVEAEALGARGIGVPFFDAW
ncbi:MAG: hypothetical protein KGL43_17090, partial [Burkholderiales bacterium]|nr:hypothetical protein [Burkholderiales bacterium]